jgi:hypothetical protein
MNKIILVGGSKGGVGKSTITVALVELYIKRNQPFHLVETDTSNPDVYKIYSRMFDEDDNIIKCLNLDEKEGWIDLINFIDATPPEYDVIVNTAARNNQSVREYGGALDEALSELKRSLITFWPINRQKDSIELLKSYMEIMKQSRIFVLLNTYFGAKEKFEIYFDTKLYKEIKEPKGATLVFPDLADRVTDLMSRKRLPLHQLVSEMPLGNRMEYKRWLDECENIFSGILFEEPPKEAKK